MSIKAEIDTLCKDLVMSTGSAFVSAPVVLMVYLGGETYHVVNASLKDAFTTSFKVEPDVHDIRIDDARIDSQKILEQMIAAIQSVVAQGKRYDDLKITFVSLMDDPIFDENSLELVGSIRDAIKQLTGFGISTRQTSFYGVFRQMLGTSGNYQNVFEFVNAGKDMWKSIYHMEISIFDPSIYKYTRLIAVNNMSDGYTMIQDTDSKEYYWKSIYMHCLKVPELIVTKLLQTIYSNQINGLNIDKNEWAENVDAELNQVFEQLFRKPEYNCEQYIPLNFFDEVKETTSKWGRRKVEEQNPIHSDIIKDKNSLQQLLDALYGSIQLKEKDYEQIMERIISAASSIDKDYVNIAQSIRGFLDRTVSDYQGQLEHLKSNSIFRETDSRNVSAYIKEAYTKKRNILIVEKKIEIINNLIQQLSNGSYLNKMIQTICGKNKEYTDTLNELIRNEYGGILESEQFNIAVLPNFKVNQPVGEILNAIGNTMLSQITNDEKIIYSNLKQFLDFKLSAASVNIGHNIGEINGNYNQLEPIISALLMTPVQSQEPQMQELLQNFPNVHVQTNSLYRENTFYVLSSRMYSSDNYIVRYKRV